MSLARRRVAFDVHHSIHKRDLKLDLVAALIRKSWPCREAAPMFC
jgi:hypothetical protein